MEKNDNVQLKHYSLFSMLEEIFLLESSNPMVNNRILPVEEYFASERCEELSIDEID